MLVCIDKLTCGRMYQRIMARWAAKLARVKALIPHKQAELAVRVEEGQRDAALKELAWLQGQAKWLEETIVEIIISEGQNEVADFGKWGFDIIPHRALMKRGFETADGKGVEVESAFKNPQHPFRVAIVCAMWLTGFDVECLSTLYVDNPMKAHTLMQAIARANRVYPSKDFGLIVDYNGMLKSLREALAQYAPGDEVGGEEEIVAPIEERVKALLSAIRQVVEKKLEQMLAGNPMRMDYYKRYSEIIADYNRDKDRVTIEETFARLVELVKRLDAEDRRAAEEGLSENEYALFCLLQKENISTADREKVKLASQGLLDSLRKLIAQRERWTEKEQTQAEVEVLILDSLVTGLPTPPFTQEEKTLAAKRIYRHVWQQSAAGAL